MSTLHETETNELEDKEKLEDEEEKEKEQAKKKELEEKGILCSITSIWEWDEEANAKINNHCQKIAKDNKIEIEYLIDKKLFKLESHSFGQLDKARDELLKLINSEASKAKQSFCIPRRSKNVVEKVHLGFSPLLDEEEEIRPMISDDDTENLKGKFQFSVAARNVAGVLGRDIPSRDYWRDISSDCSVTGYLNEEKKRIEMTGGKKKDIAEAKRKLKQLEKNFQRPLFNKKRIPIVHYPDPPQFKLRFTPLKNSNFNNLVKFDDKEINVNNVNNIYVLDFVLTQKVPDQKNNIRAAQLREYNFNKLKELKKGLEYVRVNKGELRFYASIGLAFFTGTNAGVKNSLEYTELEDFVSRHGIKPGFNRITTCDYNLAVNGFTKVFGGPPVNTTEYFEINADARNAPHENFTNVYMYVTKNATLSKVMLEWNPLVSTDWTVLNRNFDFSMILTERKAIRHDVKPFITFNKKVSVSPEGQDISFSFENIKDKDSKDLLNVKSVNFKHVYQFKPQKDQLIVELASTEEIKLSVNPNSNKIYGRTGYGKAYYTVEIYSESHKEAFKQNYTLKTGDVVKWTVEDILGKDPKLEELVQIVKGALIIIERFNNSS